ncbi:hypothetical protein OROMI_004657 [Orobanche minor]
MRISDAADSRIRRGLLRISAGQSKPCFDINEETSFVDEIDELMELIKKTWGVLGLNQMMHNLRFTWVLLNLYVATVQVENGLLLAADSQLADVAKYAKMTKDPVYAKIFYVDCNCKY